MIDGERGLIGKEFDQFNAFFAWYFAIFGIVNREEAKHFLLAGAIHGNEQAICRMPVARLILGSIAHSDDCGAGCGYIKALVRDKMALGDADVGADRTEDVIE